MVTLYEAAGGLVGLTALAHAWHERMMADPVTAHPFEHGLHPEHTDRLALYWAEALGGPADFSARIADESTVVRMHAGNGAHPELDDLAVEAVVGALADVGLTGEVARALESYFAWMTRNHLERHPDSANDVPDGMELPKWDWDGLVGPAS